MRAVRGLGTLLIILGVVLLVWWSGKTSSVGAVGHGQSPVPTSTRLPVPTLVTETPEPPPPTAKPPSAPPPPPTSTPAPVAPMLPQAGGRMAGMIGWLVLVGGGVALVLGLVLRTRPG